MIAGHFGFAAMVKSRERSTPLWGLMLATVWLDVVFVPLFLAHRETVQPIHAGYGGLIIHADYTHSIVGMLALSAALGALFLPKMGRRVALVIALVSASHWVLDLVVHRADMPVLPGNFGNLPDFGFGLWNHPQAAACVEFILVAAGAIMYWLAAREVSARAGRDGRLASLSAALIAAFGLLVLFLDYTA
ncbi:permease [Tunturiibacter empetritectus]|uniref:Phosphoglycerol transferase MdoB-like AlkP superfamily enzyme n=1 Tax=Tunturiibacter lichenicola TaxID=2051959 RepID=A0A852VCP9_9BACT|nr:permease [Edaphobacter lichenicola]NYF89267.1 phosphoglycerol transferase MdoB-like AlkP superfamily enzyme [Edaphobacter lichenicola]